MPIAEKFDYDIGVPELTPLFGRKKSLAEEIASIDVMKFNINPLPLTEREQEETTTFIYEGYDVLSDEKLFEREYTIPPAQTAEEVIGYFARQIAQNIKLPSQFSVIAPKVREFFQKKAFGKEVNLEEKLVIKAMGSNLASYVVIKEFEKALRDVLVEEKTAELVSPERFVSETNPFPFSKVVVEASKSVFNYVACDNNYEADFAKFLENSDDVTAFAKLPLQFGFSIQYTDKVANIRHYYPDFVVKLNNNHHWLIETKGREDTDVALKDNAAINWCKRACELTDINWKYIKVMQKDFENLHPQNFEELEIGLFKPDLFDSQ